MNSKEIYSIIISSKVIPTSQIYCKIIQDFLYIIENEFKIWDEMKISYNLNDKSYFKWRQIVNSIPKTWKKVLKESQSDTSNLV